MELNITPSGSKPFYIACATRVLQCGKSYLIPASFFKSQHMVNPQYPVVDAINNTVKFA